MRYKIAIMVSVVVFEAFNIGVGLVVTDSFEDLLKALAFIHALLFVTAILVAGLVLLWMWAL